MSAFSHTNVPLHALIVLLRGEGFEIGTAAMLDLQRIVANLQREDVQNVGDLKYLLGPVVCRNKEEQQKFYKLFDEYLAGVNEQTIKVEPVKPVKKKRLIWWLVACVVFGAITWAVSKGVQKKMPATLGITEWNFMKAKVAGDTVRLTVDYADSIQAINYRTDWQLSGPGNYLRSFKQNKEISAVLDSAGSYVAVASTFDSQGSLLKNDTSTVDVLCEQPPSVKISGNQVYSTQGMFTATIEANTPADTAYRFKWFVNETAVAGNSTMNTKLLKADQPNTIRLVVDWPYKKLHCSVDSLTDELNLQPPVQLLVAGDPNAPLFINQQTNWQNKLLSLTILISLPLAAIGFWWKWKSSRRKPPPQAAELAKPAEEQQEFTGPFTIEFNNQQSKIVPEAGISQLAEVLRKRHTSDVFRLNISKTISGTIKKGGFPVLEYVPRTQPTDFLILLDKEYPEGHLTRLFTFVIERLKKEQVHLTVYTFSREPLLLSNESLKHILLPIDKVARLYPDTMLIVFSQADAFFKSYDVVLKKWVNEKFKSWTTKLVITPIAKKDWGAKELALYDAGFTVVPADINAHSIISDEINHMIDRQLLRKEIVPESYSSKQFNFSRWRQVSSYLKSAATENSHRFNHGADQALLGQWLCALAVYPHINWEVTIAIGKAFEEKFSRPGQLLNYSNLLVLSRIQWMNDEQLMDSLRVEMLNHLDADKEALAREVIVQLLMEIAPKVGKDSLVKDEMDFLSTTNKFLLNANDKIGQTLTNDELEQFKEYLKNDQVDWALQTYLEKGTNTLLKSATDPKRSIPLGEYMQANAGQQTSGKAEIATKPTGTFKKALLKVAPLMAFMAVMIAAWLLLSATGKLQWKHQYALVNITFNAHNDSSQNNLPVSALSVQLDDSTYKAILTGNETFYIQNLQIHPPAKQATLQVETTTGRYEQTFTLSNAVFSYTLMSEKAIPPVDTISINGKWNDANGLFYLVLTQNKNLVKVESYSLAGSKTGEGVGSLSGKAFAFKVNIKDVGSITADTKLIDDNTLKGTFGISNNGATYSEPATLTRENIQLPKELNEIWSVQNVYEKVAINLKQQVLNYYNKGIPNTRIKMVESTIVSPNTYRIILQHASGNFEAIFVRNVTGTTLQWGKCKSITSADLNAVRQATLADCGNFINCTVLYTNANNFAADGSRYKIEFPVNSTNLYTTEAKKLKAALQVYDKLTDAEKANTTVTLSLNGFFNGNNVVLQRQSAIKRSNVGLVFSKAKWVYDPFSGNAFQRDFVVVTFSKSSPASNQPNCNRVFKSIKEAMTVNPTVVCKLDLSDQNALNLPKEVYSFINIQQLTLLANYTSASDLKVFSSRFPKCRIVYSTTALGNPAQQQQTQPNNKALLAPVLKAALGEVKAPVKQ